MAQVFWILFGFATAVYSWYVSGSKMQFAIRELMNLATEAEKLSTCSNEVGANAFLKLAAAAEAPIWVQARVVCENWKSKREAWEKQSSRIFLYSSSWRQNQARVGGGRGSSGEDTLFFFEGHIRQNATKITTKNLLNF